MLLYGLSTSTDPINGKTADITDASDLRLSVLSDGAAHLFTQGVIPIASYRMQVDSL
jgi:hypothetical protein